MKRAIGCNSALLSRLIDETKMSLQDISNEMEGVSAAMLSKLRRPGAYRYVVKEGPRTEICEYFRVTHKMDELFPFDRASGEMSA